MCPKCGQEYNCPCSSCVESFPERQPKWIISDVNGDDWNESCPNCGFKESIHWWYNQQEDQAIEEFRRGENE